MLNKSILNQNFMTNVILKKSILNIFRCEKELYIMATYIFKHIQFKSEHFMKRNAMKCIFFTIL